MDEVGSGDEEEDGEFEGEEGEFEGEEEGEFSAE